MTVAGDPAGGPLDDAEDVVTTNVGALPAAELVKATASAPAGAGDTLDYAFSVVNTGNVTIETPVITDNKCASAPVLDTESLTSDGVLEVGETQVWTCTSIPVTQDEIDAGQVENTASIDGDPVAGTMTPASDSHTAVITAQPGVDATKATADVPTAAGDSLSYTFTLVNTGNVTVTSSAIDDPKCATTPALESESLANDFVLDPGETQVWSCLSIPVTQAEVDAGAVDNTAMITLQSASGSIDPIAASSSTAIAASPSWSSVKSASSAPNEAGDTMTYTFNLDNTGNVSIADVAIADDGCASAPVLASGDTDGDGELDTDETWIYTCTSVPVTQAEVDAGVVATVATITGTPAGGLLGDGEASVAIPIAPRPSAQMVKTASAPATGAGDTISYVFVVANTGNVSIGDPVIADTKCVAEPAIDTESITEDGVLEAGETQIWSCTSIPVTQAEADAGLVRNDATFAGDPAGGSLDPIDASHVSQIASSATVQGLKATVSTPTNVGDTLDYQFTVVNTGNVTVVDVSVVDTKCATDPTIDSESVNDDGVLFVGETQIWSCTSIPVTQAEVDAGEVLNGATFDGTSAGGASVEALLDSATAVPAAPSMTIAPSTTSAIAEAGDTLDYTFAVENTGNVSILAPDVVAPDCDGAPELVGGDTDNDGEIDSGEVWEYTCTSVPVTQAQVDSGEVTTDASASGTPVRGSLPDAEATLATPITAAPAVEGAKAALGAVGAVGETIDYAFTLVNTGNVSISSPEVADAKCATDVVLDTESLASDGVLEVGETQIWTCASIPVTQDEIDNGLIENTATIGGDAAGGTLEPVEITHELAVTAAPAFEVIKATPDVPSAAGETLDYTFTVVNTGNVTITDVVVSDANCANDPGLESESFADDLALDVGETHVWSCTSVPVTQAQMDAGGVENSVTVSATPLGGTLEDRTVTITTPVVGEPGYTASVTSTNTPGAVGDTILYTFVIENTGNVSLSGMSIDAPDCSQPPVEVLRRSDDAEAPFDDLEVASSEIQPLAVVDDIELDVGETVTFVCESTPMTQEDVDEGVRRHPTTIGFDDPNVNVNPTDLVVETPVETLAELTLVKSAGSVVDVNANGLTDVGDTITYTLSVTNTGNVTATAVNVVDIGADVTGGPLPALAPGDTDDTTFSAVRVLTQADVDSGSFSNSARASATTSAGWVFDISDSPNASDIGSIDEEGRPVVSADGSPIDDGDDTNDPTRSELTRVSGIELDKVGTYVDANANSVMDVGDRIDYSFVVRNVGNVTLTSVTIDDALASVSGAITSLAPGGVDTTTFATSYVLTGADLASGEVANIATVQATDPMGQLLKVLSDNPLDATNIDTDQDGRPDDETIIVLAPENPAIGAAKELTAGPDSLADGSVTMTFRIAIENLGDVTLSGVQVEEDLTSAFGSTPYSITSVRSVSGTCTINENFDGDTITDLLTGNDVVRVGQRCLIDLAVSARPTTVLNASNQVEVTATSPAGMTLRHQSVQGSSPDANDDGVADTPNATTFVVVAPAEPDVVTTTPATKVVVRPLANDAGGATFDLSTLALQDPATGAWLATVTVANEGTWKADALTGEVSFEPLAGFTGNPTPMTYGASLAGGQGRVTSSITVTVTSAAPTPAPTSVAAPRVSTPLQFDPLPPGYSYRPNQPSAPSVQTPGGGQPDRPSGPLAFTGTETTGLAVGGLTLILVGGALVVGNRRRRTDPFDF